jgi:phosphomannomutase
LVDLQEKVRETGADVGLAFDGDADRCFVIDENGDPVTPSAIGQMVAAREVARHRDLHPGDTPTVIYNLICSRALPEKITALGAIAHRTAVGHSLIKDEMAATGAIFGAEHSAHYYFRDFWGADNGMLAALHVLAELGQSDQTLSDLCKDYSPYAASGEINSRVDDKAAVFDRILRAYTGSADIDDLDGLTVSGGSGDQMWWFNVRGSNTEPLVRLNAEAATKDLMVSVRDAALQLIREVS